MNGALEDTVKGETMMVRAALCRDLSGPDAIKMGEIESAPPGAGEVRIAVRSAAVNFPDLLTTRGQYQFKPELPFQRVKHRLDPLPEWFQKSCVLTRGLALTGRPDERHLNIGEFGLEHTTVISFVCHDHLPRRNSGWGGIEDPLKGVTFVGFCAGEREPDRQPVERGEQVQAHTPEESGMRSAVSVLGEPGKV